MTSGDRMINALEEVVGNTLRDLRERNASFCRCRRCEDDALRYSMNNLRPRYVGEAPLGAAVTRVALSQDSARAEIAVVVLDAMRRVASRPRHDGAGAAYPSATALTDREPS